MIVRIKDLVKRYDETLAIDNLNMNVREGAILGLLGPNGAGKTSTIKAIMGLVNIDSGEIKIFSKDIRDCRRDINRNIGIVPQTIAIYEELTVGENIIFFGKLYGLRGKKLKVATQEALEFVGLSSERKKQAKLLSGGMKRRLNIACGIVHKPKLIIMDEPTVGIDPQSRNHILMSVKKLNELGATIIYTSHYMEEVEAMCDDVIIMDHGRIIAKGSKEELKGMISEEDKLVIDSKNITYTVLDEIKKINGVIDGEIEENILTVICKRELCSTNEIIKTIINFGGEIINLTVERPSLEDVFLTLTGRKLRG